MDSVKNVTSSHGLNFYHIIVYEASCAYLDNLLYLALRIFVN